MSTQEQPEIKTALAQLKPQIKSAFLYTFLAGMLALAPIGYMRDVYGPVLDSRSEQTLWLVTLLLLIALVFDAFLEGIRNKHLSIISLKLAEAKSKRIFHAVFRASLTRQPPGAQQALNELRLVRNFLKSGSMIALLEMPTAFVFIILIFFIHPTMGIFSLIGAITTLALGLAAERKIKTVIEDSQRFASISSGFLNDGARNALAVEAMRMHSALEKRWLAYQGQMLIMQARAAETEAKSTILTKTVMMAQGSMLLAMTLWLSLIGLLPAQAGAYMVIAKLLGARSVQPIMTLIKSMRQIEMTKNSYLKLEEFLALVPEKKPRMQLPPPVGDLKALSVSVRIPNTKRIVVSDVNIHLKPGKSLAIIGPSGCGKSSIARVLVGLHAPASGAVRLDGADLHTWDKEELGPHLGYLPQDIELFEGTVSQNICRFGVPDEEKLKKAIELADLNSLVKSLPEGLETDIGDEGAILSGGQKQRIGLARALYGPPKLVVLDEPDSNLDKNGLNVLISGIKSIQEKGATVVLITHNPVMLKQVDQILYIANGKPKIYGARDKVLEHLNIN